MSRISLLLCVALLLAGCNQAETAPPLPTAAVPAAAAPTETPPPTEPPPPTVTPAPSPTSPPPTATLAPTATPGPTTAALGLDTMEEIIVDGGFAYRPFLTGVMTEVGPDQAFFADEAGTFIASLGGSREVDTSNSLETVLQTLLGSLSDNLGSELTAGASYPVTVGGVAGLAADVAGTLANEPLLGQLVVVRPELGQVFFAFGMGNTASGDERWTEEGRRTFATLLDSVRFFPIAAETAPGATTAASSTDACPVSVDPTYGYTEANAIRVGGDAFGGPARATAYLDTLRGPAGETVIYQRGGSSSYEGTILDAYAVFYDGAAQPVTLYIDQYTFETLYAPVGFACAAPFPFGAP